MSNEIKGRNSARKVKVVATVMAIGSILGCILCEYLEASFGTACFGVIFLISIAAFVVGRIME